MNAHANTLKTPLNTASNQTETLAGIIETLYSEHQHICSLLDTLEPEVERLRKGRVPDYALLLEIVDYLTRFPEQYHHPREDLLFTRMLEKDRGFKKHLVRLEREHKTLASYNASLHGQLKAVIDEKPIDRAELLSTFRNYVRGYRSHIEFESQEIFPRARGKLSKADLKKLSAKTRYIDDPVFGSRVEKQYRRMNQNLRNLIDEISFEIASREHSAFENVLMRIVGYMQGEHEEESAPEKDFEERSFKGKPSWQARIMNSFTRTTMKPLMRFGTIESMRSITSRFDAQQAARLPQDINAKQISGKDYEGEWVSIGRKRPKKVLLYFPGGAFIMRTATPHKAFVARICRAANAKALIVHYSLAPEIPFPGGLEDCLAAYHDLLEQGHAPEDITIAGDSAGGGLVLSTLLALRDEASPMPCNAIILSPLGDLTYSGESRIYNKHKDPMLPTHRSSEMHQLYIGDSLPDDRFISPVLANFDGLPPMLGQVGSTEILLDDTVRASQQAEKAGVPFFLEIWNEMPHVFPMFGILPEAQIAVDRMAQFINSSQLDTLPERYGAAT